ncbi:fatty-acyl-CoA synthase [Allocatelliglobosispora scoriae]|uniref:Fatty-acyl-CoA synthase n=1 Tax=Allocatelliglobosispora scoriae TaxID=643052 RepID=A0A841BNH5_9ACTN|nr:fatty acyl-AMP ligase [Allocatelliglobosispora scoriae]MBB5868749.1 fatty-acyl-CoA synthase [Allocatelliglobosispora scoriae]
MKTVIDAIAATVDRGGTLTVAGIGSRPDTVASWAELHDRARRLATTLAGHGVGPGSRVGLLGDTSVGLITAMQAVWLRGAAFTVLPTPGRSGRHAHLAHLLAVAADAAYDLVIVDDDLAGIADELQPAVAVRSLRELLAVPAPPAEVVRPAAGELAVLQYTSGSTRTPRGVPVTHGNLAANLDAIEGALGRDCLDPATACWLSWLPLYHDMGLIGFLALPMSRSCPLVLQSPTTFAMRPASWLERLAGHRATSTGAPNFAFGLMAQLLESAGDTDLSSVRLLFSGGEPIDPATMARFAAAGERHGLDPHAVVGAYGLAESTLAVTFAALGAGVTVDEIDREALELDGVAVPATAGRTSRQLVRLGRPVPGTSLRIVDVATGDPVPPRMVGEVEVSGASVVGGYWGEASREGAWLRTGDLGYLADGELVVCGRAKDVLFAAGRNVYPQDVEAAATGVPGVRPGGAAAFGIPADRGDRLVVAVESRGTDSDALRRAVAIAVAGETGMAPADVVMVRLGRLPKTSSGKLRRAETRRRYLAGELSDGLSPQPERSVR